MVRLGLKKNYRRHKTEDSRNTNQGGFTLIEVLVAVSILAFGILAVGSMQVTSIRQNAHADQVTDASVLARDRMERLMALPYANAGLNAGSYHDSNPPAGYTISWEICDGCSCTTCNTPANTKLITVTVARDGLKNIVLLNIKPGLP